MRDNILLIIAIVLISIALGISLAIVDKQEKPVATVLNISPDGTTLVWQQDGKNCQLNFKSKEQTNWFIKSVLGVKGVGVEK